MLLYFVCVSIEKEIAMNDDDAFLNYIIENPDDDTARLIYADFLEDSSDPVRRARGEFIRVQIELTKKLKPKREAELRQQETELLAQYRRKWNGWMHQRTSRGVLKHQFASRRALVRNWEYRRGFIASLRIYAPNYRDHAEVLRSIGPIERIEFVGAARVVPQWRNLPHLKGIRELSFYQCLLNQEDINALASLPGVRELQLLDLRHNLRFARVAGRFREWVLCII